MQPHDNEGPSLFYLSFPNLQNLSMAQPLSLTQHFKICRFLITFAFQTSRNGSRHLQILLQLMLIILGGPITCPVRRGFIQKTSTL
jgi:hypothetical protein